MKKFLWPLNPWIPPLLVAWGILFLSSFPIPALPQKQPTGWLAFWLIEHGVHFSEFFLFAVLVHRAWRSSLPCSSWLTLSLALATTVLLSLTNELYQLLIPTRMCDVHDMAVDALGGSLGLLLTRTNFFSNLSPSSEEKGETGKRAQTAADLF